MKKNLSIGNIHAILIIVCLCVIFASCNSNDDDDAKVNNSDLIGYWVREAHLNNPARNGSGGTVTSYGFQFIDDEKVYIFQLQHTGLSSKYSYAEANTSWQKLTEHNGISFYVNPNKELKSYKRVGNDVYIDPSSNPTIMSITGSGYMESISLDGWAEGTYVKVGTKSIDNSNGNGSNNGDNNGDNSGNGNSSGIMDSGVYVISDSEILTGVNDLGNGWYSYVLQFGFGANNDDVYKEGKTQIRLTVWADNGCTDMSYKTSNYGNKNTYTLNLSTKKDWYDWIYIQSKDRKITFNYELEYYDSKDGKWHGIQSRKLTFNANDSGGSNGNSGGNSSDVPLTGTIQGYNYVDLGLSVKWATCNVGASNPEGFGWYFQWGETTSSSFPDYYSSFQCWEDYDYYDKKTGTYKSIGDNISGTTYDAANKKWGNRWRIPTVIEWQELIKYCSWKSTTQNGVNGFLVTGRNNQSIFLPAAGRKEGNNSVKNRGYYWTANNDPYDIECAQNVTFDIGAYSYPSIKEWFRYSALSIRAVTE